MSYRVKILDIGGHINNFVGYLACAALNLAVRSLYKAVFIDTRERSEIRDKSDVRTFRCLDRTHTSIMGIVNVTYFKSCTVSGKSSGTEGGKSSLMSELRERVVLIHEL